MKHASIIFFLASVLVASCAPAVESEPLVPVPAVRSSSSSIAALAAHALSLEALSKKQFDGRDLVLGTVQADNALYTRYTITYKSGDLTISGIMNIPKGEGPFPVVIMNHGYIDTSVYTNGRGLKREQDYFARRGYAVLHPDYRNHASSGKDPEAQVNLRLGYVEDVINAIEALKKADLPAIDTTRIAMIGHSMGGGVTMNVLVTRPDLVDAAMLYAPVSAVAYRNIERWILRQRPEAATILERYGTPEENSEFWDSVSAKSYFDRITAPVMINHGDADKDVPVEWSRELAIWLKEASVETVYNEYPREPHEFAQAWTTVMERTIGFFNEHLE